MSITFQSKLLYPSFSNLFFYLLNFTVVHSLLILLLSPGAMQLEKPEGMSRPAALHRARRTYTRHNHTPTYTCDIHPKHTQAHTETTIRNTYKPTHPHPRTPTDAVTLTHRPPYTTTSTNRYSNTALSYQCLED